MNEIPAWLERAKETFKFHRAKLTSNDEWTIAQTARSLRRSLGSVSEHLLIARWCKTHEKQLEKFEFQYQALKFIREKQREMDKEGIE